ncbi:MAG: hypothetical protein QNJ12_09250 [Ilumatobacter sp.]|nr:hypothetical protein [Ilumatobacter sp.]MDJ0768969.1 hypothetical protein [Ilumatobacter sp.]
MGRFSFLGEAPPPLIADRLGVGVGVGRCGPGGVGVAVGESRS